MANSLCKKGNDFAGTVALRHAANVSESGIRNKLTLDVNDDCSEGAEALKETNFCKRRLWRT